MRPYSASRNQSFAPSHFRASDRQRAYTRTYGDSEQPSTRPKDLVHILLIESSTAIEADALRQALDRTFAERARQPLPTSLPPPPTIWADPFKRLAATVEVESDLSVAFARAAAFFDPVLAGHVHGQWHPQRRTWITTDE